MKMNKKGLEEQGQTGKVITVKGYEGNNRLQAGLIYEMLMEKKESGEYMHIGSPSHKVEIMIQEVTKKEREDIVKNEIIYKVEFKAVVV